MSLPPEDENGFTGDEFCRGGGVGAAAGGGKPPMPCATNGSALNKENIASYSFQLSQHALAHKIKQ